MIGERRTENTGRSGGGAAEKTTMRIFSKSRDRIAGRPACNEFRSSSDFLSAAPEETMNVPFAVRGRSVHGPHCRPDSSWIPFSWPPPPQRPSSRDGMHLPSFAVSTARRPPSPRQSTYCAPPPSITGRNAARHKAHRIDLSGHFIVFSSRRTVTVACRYTTGKYIGSPSVGQAGLPARIEIVFRKDT